MSVYPGEVQEIRLEGEQTVAFIACQPEAIPGPGQFLQAQLPGEDEAVLATSLFLGAEESSPAGGPSGFAAAPPIPHTWTPGVNLQLRGPLGRGFTVPPNTWRLALAGLDGHPSRLLPLISPALAGRAEVALFTNADLPRLPSAVEANPLNALPEALAWADFLAIDVPWAKLSLLRNTLGLGLSGQPPCPAQVLVYAPMPCGGMAACGVCAVKARRGYKLACEDGPVFPLEVIAY